MLAFLERHCCQRRIQCFCLTSTTKSAWKKVKASQCDAAMITLTGLDCISFNKFESEFEPYFHQLTPLTDDGEMRLVKAQKFMVRTGRTRSITHADCLALMLIWLRTRGSTFTLQMMFGLTATSISKYLWFSHCLLIHILSNHKDAKASIPLNDKVEEYTAAVASKHPLLKDVWMTMDGHKLYLKQSLSCLI